MGTKQVDPKAATYYDCIEGQERLSYRTADEAIEAHLDDYLYSSGDCPETVTAFAWIRQVVCAQDARPDLILERTLEDLDEEHADPEGDPTKPTKDMQEAANAFAAVIAADYVCWTCDRYPAADMTVNVQEWVKEHRPDWLPGRPKAQ